MFFLVYIWSLYRMDCIAIVQNIDEDYFVQNFEFE